MAGSARCKYHAIRSKTAKAVVNAERGEGVKRAHFTGCCRMNERQLIGVSSDTVKAVFLCHRNNMIDQ